MTHSHEAHDTGSQKSSKKEFNPWFILPYLLLFVFAVVWVPRELSRDTHPALTPLHMGKQGHKIGNVSWDFEPMGFLDGNLYVKLHLHGNPVDISRINLEAIALKWDDKVYFPDAKPTLNQKHYSSALIYQTAELPPAFSIRLPIDGKDTLYFDFGGSTNG